MLLFLIPDPPELSPGVFALWPPHIALMNTMAADSDANAPYIEVTS